MNVRMRECGTGRMGEWGLKGMRECENVVQVVCSVLFVKG